MRGKSKRPMPYVFIPTKNRPTTIATHRYFEGYEYFVLVHSKEQYNLYKKSSEMTELDMDRVMVTNTTPDQFGLTRQREWVINDSGLLNRNEWFIYADDNIKDITAVNADYYDQLQLPVQNTPLREVYENPCTPVRFMGEIFSECVDFAESLGAQHLGFSAVDNFFFRGNKWKKAAYIIGKLMIWKNSGMLEFDHTITMEDFELTAQSIVKFGCAPVNNFVYPVAGHYEMGGMGTKKERLPDRQRDVEKLTAKYPGLFNVKMRPDGNPDLSLKYHTAMAIEHWRRSYQLMQSPRNLWK